MNAALERSKGTFLTDKETQELKSLYRRIVKVLHKELDVYNLFKRFPIDWLKRLKQSIEKTLHKDLSLYYNGHKK